MIGLSTRNEANMWGNNLREYILAMHGVDIVWTPKDQNDQPPF